MKTHPDHFELESYEGLGAQPFDFKSSECVIIGTQGGPSIWNVEIKFTYKYNELLKIALESLKRIRIERSLGGRVTMASEEKAMSISKSLPPPKKMTSASNVVKTSNNTRASKSNDASLTSKSSASKTSNTTVSSSTPNSAALGRKGNLRSRRRLADWLGGVFGKKGEPMPMKQDESTKEKKKSVDESTPGGVEFVAPVASAASAAPAAPVPSALAVAASSTSESVDSSETLTEGPSVKTGTFEYFQKSQLQNISKEEGPKPLLPESAEAKKALKEMVEMGGQKIDIGTKASNHSAGISYSRFISEHGMHEVGIFRCFPFPFLLILALFDAFLRLVLPHAQCYLT